MRMPMAQHSGTACVACVACTTPSWSSAVRYIDFPTFLPRAQSLNPRTFTVYSKTNNNRVPAPIATKPRSQRPRSLQRPQRRLVSRHPRADPHLLHQRHTLQLRTCNEAYYDPVCEGGGSCDSVSPHHDGHWCVPALQDAESLQREYEHWGVGECVVDLDRIVYTGDVAE